MKATIVDVAKKAGVSAHYASDKIEAASLLKDLVKTGDVILLKGSHSMEVDTVADLAFGKEGLQK